MSKNQMGRIIDSRWLHSYPSLPSYRIQLSNNLWGLFLPFIVSVDFCIPWLCRDCFPLIASLVFYSLLTYGEILRSRQRLFSPRCSFGEASVLGAVDNLGTVFPRSPLPDFSPLSLDLPYVVGLGEAP